ncbi:uncharacterized protein LOC125535490 [Triticum urartu]|uniref:uncharacterized protein LOC125535490 n=1 Tax=Triticum urartu TaxID=4572 RepID=UPI0020433082|nr:uncharacterized protein LOC125535490 [Triticum urartu]
MGSRTKEYCGWLIVALVLALVGAARPTPPLTSPSCPLWPRRGGRIQAVRARRRPDPRRRGHAAVPAGQISHLSHHRRCVLNAEIRRAKAKLLEEDPPKLHAGHNPPPANLLGRIRVLLPKQSSPASPPSGQRRWRRTSPLPPLPQHVGHNPSLGAAQGSGPALADEGRHGLQPRPLAGGLLVMSATGSISQGEVRIQVRSCEAYQQRLEYYVL